MRFGIYTEMQHWPGKSPERLYAEVSEQIVHADRLGYDVYQVIEHFFFPRFSISPDPLALFAQVAPRTRQIAFRTMLHVLPYHNPTVLASRIAAAEILLDGRYEFGVGRVHGSVPPKAGVRMARRSRSARCGCARSGAAPASWRGRSSPTRCAAAARSTSSSCTPGCA